jgi:hypothetical protein
MHKWHKTSAIPSLLTPYDKRFSTESGGDEMLPFAQIRVVHTARLHPLFNMTTVQQLLRTAEREARSFTGCLRLFPLGLFRSEVRQIRWHGRIRRTRSRMVR